jgi:hypothetical protein
MCMVHSPLRDATTPYTERYRSLKTHFIYNNWAGSKGFWSTFLYSKNHDFNKKYH